MPADPLEADPVAFAQVKMFLPEVCVLGLLPRLRIHPFSFQRFAQPLTLPLNTYCSRNKDGVAWASSGLQALYAGLELHAVVRRQSEPSGEFLPMHSCDENNAPASGPGFPRQAPSVKDGTLFSFRTMIAFRYRNVRILGHRAGRSQVDRSGGSE